MKRLLAVVALGAFASVLAAADARSWTGMITDNTCAAEGHFDAECAKRCVKSGKAKWAIYDSADKTAYILSDQKRAGEMAGKQVVVKGTLDEKTKTIEVASIEPAPSK
jgi:nitrogen fixation protein FixH